MWELKSVRPVEGSTLWVAEIADGERLYSAAGFDKYEAMWELAQYLRQQGIDDGIRVGADV